MTCNADVHPTRLVMIQVENSCMFCEKPEGISYTNYVDTEDKLGYISCFSCLPKMEEATKEWHSRLMYGRALYLKDTEFSIRRSSGEIESGWKIYVSPYTRSIRWDVYKQKEIVYCANDEKQLLRWCHLDDILELNPPSIVTKEETYNKVWRNLCVNCSIDMGEDNPRQYCCKTYCPNEEGEYN